MKRIAASLVLLALALGAGCSGSGDESKKSETIEAREVPAIYADILAQRDLIHAAISKGTAMWHEDCAQVVAAANELNDLFLELQKRAATLPSLDERRRGFESHAGLTLGLVATMEERARGEIVGALPALMIELDRFLLGLEHYFTPEQLGGRAVAQQPGFNPNRPPPPPSPI